MIAAPARALAIRDGPVTTDRRIGLVAALLATAVASLALATPLDPFDGGIAASAANFTLQGLLPYRDYWLLYGPLAGWVLAVPLAVFGPSVELLRVAGLVLVAAQAYLGYRIALRWTNPGAAVLIATSATVLAPAFMGLEFSAWPLAMVFALAALLLRMEGRSAVLVGCVIGLAFLTRIDLGAYVLIACLVLPTRLPLLLGFAAVTLPVVTFALLTAPLSALTEQLVWFPLVGQRRFRALYDLASTMPPLSATVLAVPLAIVPRLAILGSLLWLVRARADRPLVALTVFAALCQLQALSRTDGDHLALAATPAILLFARWVGTGGRRSTVVLALVSASCIGGAVAGFNQATDQGEAQATGVLQAVDVVAATTTRDDPIFAGLASHRYTFANPLLVYFLADRPPGSTYTMFNPGVTNTEAVQRRMIAELEASGTKVLVLDLKWADYREPENESRIPGSDALDRYIADRFHVLCDLGAVRVAVRNDVAALDRGCPVAGGGP